MKKYDKEITEFLESRGYTVKTHGEGIYTFINGVKTEWKSISNKLAVGYGGSRNDVKQLRKLVTEIWGKNSLIGSPKSLVHFRENASPDDFYRLVELVENLPFDLEKPCGIRGKVSFDKNGVFRKMAELVRYAVDKGQPQLLNRGPLGMDSVDDIIIIGESVSRTPENSYREHIIPCDFLISEAVEMVKRGDSDAQIAMMFKNLLNIVLITPDQAKYLDSDLGLKVDMPDGWKVGDDPFARLKIASIELK